MSQKIRVLHLSSTKTFTNTISFLSNKLCDVIQVNNLKEAENLLYKEKFDVAVVSDNFSSTLVLFEFMEKIKKIKKDLPIVFLAFTQESAQKAKIYGANEVLTLPYLMSKPESYLKDVVERFAKKPFYEQPYFRETTKEDTLD